jgi:two-component system, NtrC family, sensor kinase
MIPGASVDSSRVGEQGPVLIERLAAGIAHEINNPAGYIVGNIEVLASYVRLASMRYEETRRLVSILSDTAADSSNDSEVLATAREAARQIDQLDEEHDYAYIAGDAHDLVTAVGEGMRRIGAIVEALRAYTRSSGLEEEIIDLSQCVSTALIITRNELKYEYTVNVELEDDLTTRAIPSQIEQALVSILLYARDMMPSGGAIRIHGRRDGDTAVIELSDGGGGVDASGSLGLAVAYQAVSDAGGSITVTRRHGDGTTFSVRLPFVSRP